MSIYTNPPSLSAPSQAGGAVAPKPQPPPYGSGASAPVATSVNPESGIVNAHALVSPSATTPVYGGSLNGATPQVMGPPASASTNMGGPAYAGLANSSNATQYQMENGPQFDGVLPLLLLAGVAVVAVYLLTKKG
jgi:hypothetical protein